MVREFFYGLRKDNDTQSNGKTWRNRAGAIVALLAAGVFSSLAVGAQNNSNKFSEIADDQSVTADTVTTDGNTDTTTITEQKVTIETPTPDPSSNSQSISTEVKIENGVTDTKVLVNGREVPVNSRGSTHTVIIGDGSQTKLHVDIQNEDVSNTTVRGSSSTSSSSTDIQSQTIITSP